MTKTEELHESGILLYSTKDIEDVNRGKAYEAISQINKVIQNRPKSIVVELNVFRKYVPILMKWAIVQNQISKDSVKAMDRHTTDCQDKKRQRWSDTEDQTLIDLVCDERNSMMEIARTIGRTPGAIQSRLSHLVGVKRLSQKVAGRFIGKADGKDTIMDIQGIVYND